MYASRARHNLLDCARYNLLACAQRNLSQYTPQGKFDNSFVIKSISHFFVFFNLLPYILNMVLSKGIILLVISSIVFFIIYMACSNNIRVLPGNNLSPASVTFFAPMPGSPPLQSILPILQTPQEQKREGFTVKFAKRTQPQTPMTPVRSIEVQTDCPPPPPPPQQLESVSISYRHGEPRYEESAPSSAQVSNQMSGIRISPYNPLFIL